MIVNFKKLHPKSTIAVLFACLFVLFAFSIVSADTCQIIRIEEGRGGTGTRLEIIPANLTVSAGTCTVWINWVTGKEVRVSFREKAKACATSTGPVSGFKIIEGLKAGESCFLSESLPRGKTASIVWKKPGVYKYTLEASGSAVSGGIGLAGPILANGVIEVK